MKALVKSLIAALFMGLLAVPLRALDVEFGVVQNTGSWVEVQTLTDAADCSSSGYAVAPGHALWAFSNWWPTPPWGGGGGYADARAAVDSTYSKGRYYIGYYYGASNAYLTIY